MDQYLNFYINGQWLKPRQPKTMEVINPATQKPYAVISMGTREDVDLAVAAARNAFNSFAQQSVVYRIELLKSIIDSYQKHSEQIGDAIMMEMGAPKAMAHGDQVSSGLDHLKCSLKTLENFKFDLTLGESLIRYEPIGVCGMITPWNWPINQICSKVAPALAAGCTMVLKPSEIAPISGHLFAQVMDEAGVPAGVFNLINGDGLNVGEAMSAHSDIDMMSFTGSTRGGVAVAKASAGSVKRVAQELGGKSANIILNDADIVSAVENGVDYVMANSGQSCDAPTRMLVPHELMDEVIKIAAAKVQTLITGDPNQHGVDLGPVVSEVQFTKIQNLIQKGIDEKATLVSGGVGRPQGLDQGYYVKPTIFAHVTNDMTIAKEEIFGPVLTIIGYEDEDEAIQIANDTVYGLADYISSKNKQHALNLAKKLKAGQVHINYEMGSLDIPFGGYKQSGNGREQGSWGMHEFLEVKAITGAV